MTHKLLILHIKSASVQSAHGETGWAVSNVEPLANYVRAFCRMPALDLS
jgi:hypothetical protein